MKIIENIKKFFTGGYDAVDYRQKDVKQLYGDRKTPRSEDELVGTWDRMQIIQRCMDLWRNDFLAAAIGRRMEDNIVGAGITPQAKTKDPAWNTASEQFWGEWTKVCDIRRRLDMTQMQKKVVSARMFQGDIGFLFLDNGKLQPIEGERIATPEDKKKSGKRIVEGIEVDKSTGEPLGYYIFDRDDKGMIDTKGKEYKYIPQNDIVYCSSPFRTDQLRALPEITPVIHMLGQLKAFGDALLSKAQLDAMHAWAIKSNSITGPGNLGSRLGSSSEATGAKYERFERGMNYYLRPDEDAVSLASNTPNAQFAEYFRILIRCIGSPLGLPLEILLMDFSLTNFSASRAALLQTYQTFATWQNWLVSSFLQRVWNWRIAKAIEAKILPPAPKENGQSQWYKVDWSFPEYGWIDPNNEAISEQREIAMGKKPLRDIIRKTGKDIEDVLRAKRDDIAIAAKHAEDLAKLFPGQEFNWMDLISTSTSGGHTKIEGSTVKTDGGVKEL